MKNVFFFYLFSNYLLPTNASWRYIKHSLAKVEAADSTREGLFAINVMRSIYRKEVHPLEQAWAVARFLMNVLK